MAYREDVSIYILNETNNKPEIVTGQYNSPAKISSLNKSRTRLYFLMSVASEARIEKNYTYYIFELDFF
jgi:hypothetical protein